MKNYKEIIQREIMKSQDLTTLETFKRRVDIYANGEVYVDDYLVRLAGKINLDDYIRPADFVSKYDGFYYGELPDGAAKLVTLEVKRYGHERDLYVYISVGYTCGGFVESSYTWWYYKTPEELEKLWEEYDLPVYEEAI